MEREREREWTILFVTLYGLYGTWEASSSSLDRGHSEGSIQQPAIRFQIKNIFKSAAQLSLKINGTYTIPVHTTRPFLPSIKNLLFYTQCLCCSPTIWGSYGPNMGNIWVHMGSYGANMDHMGPYGSTWIPHASIWHFSCWTSGQMSLNESGKYTFLAPAPPAPKRCVSRT